MVKSKVGSLSSADATEEKGDDHVVDDVADDLKLQQFADFGFGVRKTAC
jgi:hypothetical protein